VSNLLLHAPFFLVARTLSIFDVIWNGMDAGIGRRVGTNPA
jgi:hypothetical protein